MARTWTIAFLATGVAASAVAWLASPRPVPTRFRTPGEVLAAVRARDADVPSLSADFVHTTRSPLFGDEVVEGHLDWERPDRMRWTFGASAGFKTVVTDGERMWIYAPEDRQVIEYSDLDARQDRGFPCLIRGGCASVAWTVEAAGNGWTRAGRGSHEPAACSMVLTLDADLVPVRLRVVDAFDTTTDVVFLDVRTDVVFPPGHFVFTPQAGAEGIDATPRPRGRRGTRGPRAAP